MHINQAGLALIKHFEGLRLKAYKDSVGIWTIGYGHTATAHEGMSVSEEQALELLKEDLADTEAGVTSLVKPPVTPNQFSAMVCFAFNVGLGNFKQSTLLRSVNCHQWESAAKEFLRWNKAGGKVLPGLTLRREAEKALFESA